MKFNKFKALIFIFLFFVFGFVLFFWSEPISFGFLNLKLIWSIAGLLGAIFIGIIDAK